jgi:hypothetical protein
MTKQERTAAILLGLLFAVSLAAYLLDPALEISLYFRNILYLVPPFVAMITALFAARSFGVPSRHSRNFVFMAGGLMLWFVGEVLFTSYTLVGVDPFPSMADIFYLLAYPLMAYGLISEARLAQAKAPRRDQITFYVAAAILAAVVVYTGIIQAYDPDSDLLSNLVAMSYGVADLGLIFVVGRMLLLARALRGGTLAFRWFILLAGFGSILVGDILFALFTAEYEAFLQPFLLLDMFFIGGYCTLAYGFVSIASLLRSIRSRASIGKPTQSLTR